MGLAQTLLTIAAISLLGMITLTLNSSYLTTNQVMVESEFSVEAVSLAESYLERAIGKTFDEKSITAQINNTSDLSKIGRETGEKDLVDFDDFDDFHGFIVKDTTERAVYNVAISIVYVNESKPDIKASGKTWHKKMNITVSNEFMKTPISMHYVFSYFGGSGGSGGSDDDDDDDDDDD